MRHETTIHPRVLNLRTYKDLQDLRLELGLSITQFSLVAQMSIRIVHNYEKTERLEREAKLTFHQMFSLNDYLLANNHLLK